MPGEETRDYRVVWEITADSCPSPRAAAEFALQAQREPGSWATVFTVYPVGDESGTEVDLEVPGCPECEGTGLSDHVLCDQCAGTGQADYDA